MRTTYQHVWSVTGCRKLSCLDDPGAKFVASQDDGDIRFLRLVVFYQKATRGSQ